MADFIPVSASNNPRINDHAAVEAVLARYWLDPEFSVGVGFNEDTGEPYLFAYGYVWPEAWKVPEGVSPADFDPFDGDTYEEGEDGFLTLLRELTPYLAEPLTIHSIGSVKCRFPLSATEWHIEPGSRKVKIQQFRHAYDQPATV